MRIPRNHQVVILYLIGSVFILYAALIQTDYRLVLFILGGVYTILAVLLYVGRLYWLLERVKITPPVIYKNKIARNRSNEVLTQIIDDDDDEEGLLRWWVTTPLLPETIRDWSVASLIVLVCALFFGISLIRLLAGYSGVEVFLVWNTL